MVTKKDGAYQVGHVGAGGRTCLVDVDACRVRPWYSSL